MDNFLSQGTLHSTSDAYTRAADRSQVHGAGAIKPQAVYSKVMLRTIQLEESDYAFIKLGMKRLMPANSGTDDLVIKRMLTLSAHTQPLVEGIPPAADQGRLISIKCKSKQYGRYMEFTDKVNWKTVDPLIAEYTRLLAAKVPETKDILAHEALQSECQIFYASEKVKDTTTNWSFKEKANGSVNHIVYLTPDCSPTIDDFRRVVLTMEAARVRPYRGGNFLSLLSAAVYFDLISDERVREYMKYENTAHPYKQNAIVDLFSLEFQKAKTTKQDNTFIDASGTVQHLYHVTGLKSTTTGKTCDGPANVHSDTPYETAGATTMFTVVPLTKTVGGAYEDDSFEVEGKAALDALITAGSGTIDKLNAHYSYILGEECLIETGVQGHTEPQFISKPLGSAGANDPLNQKQTIGWKLDSIGYKVGNPDAVQAYISVPTQYKINTYPRPDMKNEFHDYDYGYVAEDGSFYYPTQVQSVMKWDADTSANKVVYIVKGTTTEVTPQKLTKLLDPANAGRVLADGQKAKVSTEVPVTHYALKSNTDVMFTELQVVKHSDNKFYIKGLAGESDAEVVELPQLKGDKLNTSSGNFNK